ncbi:MAG: hypothetical protein IGS23_20840 [Rivularia sp. T60_A2020_040]|nr:hypothetical protein [Rivularia sp. T60_A2020_040]
MITVELLPTLPSASVATASTSTLPGDVGVNLNLPNLSIVTASPLTLAVIFAIEAKLSVKAVIVTL